MNNHPLLSQEVSSQLPRFVKADHPMFVSFLEAYYEWLETTGDVGAFDGGLDLLSQRDIDSTFDSFVEYFRKEYLLHFPEKLAVDSNGNPLNQKNLIKNIRQFFRAKGSEKSFEFLFRVLYNSSIEFYYPKEDVLRLSDGKWVQRKSIKTTSNNDVNLFGLLQQEIKQRNDSGEITAYARVSDLQLYPVDGVQIAEFFLAGAFGTFNPSRNIEGLDGDGNLLKEFVFPVIESVTITEGGKDYQPGETIRLKSSDPTKNPVGSGFLARIDEVDTQNSLYKTDEEIQLGSIKKLRIIDFGFNYQDISEWTVVVDSPFGTDAVLDINLGGVSDYPGYYEGTDGQLSSNKKIQDSHYFQQFSYVLRVESSFEKWIDVIKKIIHPAGMEVFGEVLLYRRRIDTVDGQHNEFRVYENTLIGHYTPYRFQTYENLRNNSAGIDLYPQGYNPFACSVSGGDGRGTVPEWGVTAHNPYDIPSGQTQFVGPLSTNITDINGHNAHCPDFDLNNNELGYEGCSGGWTPCEFTPFAVADGALNADGISGGNYGCCTDTDYWIIYPHPNSRGISYIPPTVDIKRLWLHTDGNVVNDEGHDPRLAINKIEIHERISQNRKEESIDYDQVTGSDLRPFLHQQSEAEFGIVYDLQTYPDDTTVRVTGTDGVTQVKPTAHLDVLSETNSFMGNEYQAGITGYHLVTEYSDISIEIGSAEEWVESFVASATEADTVTRRITTEDVNIPNPFLHITINDFFHMPIDSGTTGDEYKHRSTTNYDLSYQQVR